MARRTVTKYREELHIPAARFRRKVFDKNSKDMPREVDEPMPTQVVETAKSMSSDMWE